MASLYDHPANRFKNDGQVTSSMGTKTGVLVVRLIVHVRTDDCAAWSYLTEQPGWLGLIIN
jgi:hypothetical protein